VALTVPDGAAALRVWLPLHLALGGVLLIGAAFDDPIARFLRAAGAIAAALILTCWLAGAAWWGYRALRQIIVGLDYIVLSLALFAVAVLVSLRKSGALSRHSPPAG